MKRRELKPGDIVRVYGCDKDSYYWKAARGVVKGSDPHIPDVLCVEITIRGVVYTAKVHRNQCTPIRIIKKKRRECWVREQFYDASTFSFIDEVRKTPPDNLDGWIHLKECKPKK